MNEKLGIDQFVLKCWEIDDTGWKFRMVSDLWWEVVAISDRLGKFRAVSYYQTDVEDTLARLLDDINKVKDNT